MLEYLFLLFSLLRATVRDREALVAENLVGKNRPLEDLIAAIRRAARPTGALRHLRAASAHDAIDR